MGTDLNGRGPKTGTEKDGKKPKKEELTKGTDLNGREPFVTGGIGG